MSEQAHTRHPPWLQQAPQLLAPACMHAALALSHQSAVSVPASRPWLQPAAPASAAAWGRVEEVGAGGWPRPASTARQQVVAAQAPQGCHCHQPTNLLSILGEGGRWHIGLLPLLLARIPGLPVLHLASQVSLVLKLPLLVRRNLCRGACLQLLPVRCQCCLLRCLCCSTRIPAGAGQATKAASRRGI